MQPARDAAEFAAAPLGRYLSGESWLYVGVDANLYAQVYWGRASEEDARTLASVWLCELGDAPPHDSFVDASRVEGIDAAAFSVLQRHLEQNRAQLARCVRRQAVVRPTGMVGAVVAGFYEVLSPAYPVRVFADAASALDWLGRGSLAKTLARLSADATAQDPLVRRLRERLAADPSGAEISSLARALGISTRTLQRRLGEAGTTFVAEVGRARVAVAQALLADTDRKLTAIALEVGCASLQHFSALFRRVTGFTPSAWRAQHGSRIQQARRSR